MKYCSLCGNRVEQRVPPGDQLPRHICTSCDAVHYQNPNMVVGCVVEHEGQILICKRAIEPRKGYWTIPAGFLENHETLAAGAARETVEEACAQVEMGGLLAIVDVPQARQVHIMYRAKLVDGRFGAGDETLESRLVDEADMPWDEIAFASVRFALEAYFSDRAQGRSEVHTVEIPPMRLRR